MLVLWNMRDRDLGHAAVSAVWADPNTTIDALFCERRKTRDEDARGGVPWIPEPSATGL